MMDFIYPGFKGRISRARFALDFLGTIVVVVGITSAVVANSHTANPSEEQLAIIVPFWIYGLAKYASLVVLRCHDYERDGSSFSILEWPRLFLKAGTEGNNKYGSMPDSLKTSKD